METIQDMLHSLIWVKSHLAHQMLVEFKRGIIPHPLLAVVHCRNFKYNCKISSGTNRNSDGRDVYSQDIHGFIVDSKSVIHFSLYPRLKIYNKVDFFCVLNRTYAEKTLDINYSYAAKLNIMADYFGCTSHKRGFRHLFDLNSIVRNESVTSLYKLDGSFALSDAAVSEKQKTFAVNLNKNTVSGNSGGKLNMEISNYSCKQRTCSFLA